MSIDEIVEACDRERKAAKGGWWTYIQPSGGVRVKGYGTWCQRVIAGSIIGDTSMNATVKQMKQELREILESAGVT